jgi:hypothetical protein
MDFSKFKLVRIIPTSEEEDEDEEEGFGDDEERDPELDYECQWLRVSSDPASSARDERSLLTYMVQRVKYNIVGPQAKVFGQIRCWLIDIEEIRDSFYAEMDVPRCEHISYTSIFTPCSSRAGRADMVFVFSITV